MLSKNKRHFLLTRTTDKGTNGNRYMYVGGTTFYYRQPDQDERNDYMVIIEEGDYGRGLAEEGES